MKKFIYLATTVIYLLSFQLVAAAQVTPKDPPDKSTKMEVTPADKSKDTKPPTESISPETKAKVKKTNTMQALNAGIYLKTDKLFKNVALQEAAGVDENTLESFAQSVEKNLSDEANPERKAAKLLIELQDEPVILINKYTDANAAFQQKSLLASELITEFVKKLIRDSATGTDDPLLEYVNGLDTVEGQELLNADLNQRLGTGIEREIKAALILIEIRTVFNKESLDKLRMILKSNQKESARLPYPLCLLKKPCPS